MVSLVLELAVDSLAAELQSPTIYYIAEIVGDDVQDVERHARQGGNRDGVV